MNYRKLGISGLSVSEVGMGCNRIGEPIHDDDHWINLIHHAIDLGVNIFDTSERYQKSRSEELLGKAIGNRRDVYIATKMAPIPDTLGEFTAARMVETLENSLKRLQRDYIDIYQLHSPTREAMEKYDWIDGMLKLRAQGKIHLRAVAIRTIEDGMWLIENNAVDVLQITYNIFETAPENGLFDLARKHQIGLMCRMPLARGILTGKFKAGEGISDDHRATLQGDRLSMQVEQAEQLRSIGTSYDGGMTRMAHHFSLRPNAISCIIPGARNNDQLEQNVAASAKSRMSYDVYRQIMEVRAGWS